MQATPSTWRMLIGAGWNGAADCGSSAAASRWTARWPMRLLTESGLWNLYGPTETTIWSTCARVDSGPVTVGDPIAIPACMYSTHDCGRCRSASPASCASAATAGARLSRPAGADRRALRRRSVHATGAAVPHRRPRALARDGTLEFLGRLDHQVKLRGFRIELGEIEAALDALPSIAHAAVVSHSAAADDQRLVAYVVAGRHRESSTLRAQLRAELPDYMVPALIVPLPALPLTPNGKLDRRALPAPDWSGAPAVAVAPRDAIEAALAGLFAEVLGVQAVGVHDDFFDLGGHSLLATQLVARIRDAFAVELPLLRCSIRRRWRASPAAAVRRDGPARTSLPARRARPVRVTSVPAEAPLSFVQQRLWFLDQLEPGNPVYNLVWAVRARGELDVTALEQSVACVVARHEALRTSFASVDGRRCSGLRASRRCRS